MKKNYLKPSINTIGITIDNIMLGDSQIGFGEDATPSATKGKRGEWGDVWSK